MKSRTVLALCVGACVSMCRGTGTPPPVPEPAATAHDGGDIPPPASFVSIAAPLGTIGQLIRAAASGDTVTVPHGVYYERLVIDKPLSLIADGEVVIDGGGSGDIVAITAPDVTLRGFVVRNTGISLDDENAGIRVLAPRATLDRNVLEDILFGIDLRESPDSRVTHNRIGGKQLNIARRGDGLRLWRSDRTLVEGNTIHDGRGRDHLVFRRRGCTRQFRVGLPLRPPPDVQRQRADHG